MSFRGNIPGTPDSIGDPPNGPTRPRAAVPARTPRGPSRLWWILGALLLLIIVVPSFFVEMITDWMWFGSQNLDAVYTTRLWLAVAVFIIAAIIGALFCAVNWIFAWRVSRPQTTWPGQVEPISSGAVRGMTALAAIVAGIFLGITAAEEWPTILLFLNGVPFGEVDPVFGEDVGFYIFGLPFWNFLRGWGFGVLSLAAIGSAIIYAIGVLPAINRQVVELQKSGKPGDIKLNLDPRIGVHGSMLGAIFLMLIALGYYLGRYDLLYSSRASAYGAGYTDVNARLPAQYILLGVAVLMGILLLVNLRVRTWRLLVGALGVWFAALVLVGGVYPAIVQEAVVKPNELDQERPYIQNNITATRKAFGLDKFSEREVPAVESVTRAQLAASPNTVDNIRLWDYRPLLDTYAQLQEIRQYYTFTGEKGVDIDRYIIDGKVRQIMLSARELSTSELGTQSRTWQNEHFYYTHGYGAVASPVNEIEGEGLPRLLLRDIPRTDQPALKIDRPEIYFGEAATEDSYAFVNSDQPEFDYPEGDNNKETQYQGAGGVPVSGFFEKVLFALRFGEGKVLLNDDITPGTRVLFHRNIHDSVRLLVPFLMYDNDPYLVIADGKMYWIQDAYTVSDRYPYSTPIVGDRVRFNYIRNSVKVVIDAYNGTHTFYVADNTDPLVRAYRGIFPALFKDIAEMPASLRSHVRYPEDLMNYQAEMYAIFHMTRPDTFYAKEDAWTVPSGSQSENSAPLEAYYVIMQLPGSAKEEFILMRPFTPVNRPNMIAWMAAKSDGENYGQVEVIRYPKQQQVFGPSQIEARINQDPTISSQLSLWNQGGSKVLQGNLITLPISNSVLYVQPLFLQATASSFPELKRVIVATGNSVGFGEDLQTALDVAFKVRAPVIIGDPNATPVPPTPGVGGTPVPGATQPPAATPAAGSAPDLVQSAQRHYDAAQSALRTGDLADYQREIDAMKEDLDALARLVGVPTGVPLPGGTATPGP